MTLPRYQDHQAVIMARKMKAGGCSLVETAGTLNMLSRELDLLLWEFVGVSSESLNERLPRHLRYTPDF